MSSVSLVPAPPRAQASFAEFVHGKRVGWISNGDVRKLETEWLEEGRAEAAVELPVERGAPVGQVTDEVLRRDVVLVRIELAERLQSELVPLGPRQDVDALGALDAVVEHLVALAAHHGREP